MLCLRKSREKMKNEPSSSFFTGNGKVGGMGISTVHFYREWKSWWNGNKYSSFLQRMEKLVELGSGGCFYRR